MFNWSNRKKDKNNNGMMNRKKTPLPSIRNLLLILNKDYNSNTNHKNITNLINLNSKMLDTITIQKQPTNAQYSKSYNFTGTSMHKSKSSKDLYEESKKTYYMAKLGNNIYKEKSVLLYKPKFNYSCHFDKGMINLKIKKGPRQKKNFYFLSNKNEKEMQKLKLKLPRMLQIIKQNEKTTDKFFSLPFQHPELFKNLYI